jgi:gliding motility-associated-like protein
MLKRIFLLTLIFFLANNIHAVVVLNQSSNTGGATGSWMGSITGQQTFVPTVSGKLFRVRVHTATYGSATTVLLKIFSGVPGSGILLTSTSYGKPTFTNSWDDVILPGIGVDVTNGSTYYIEITSPSAVDWIYSGSNPYTSGSAYRGGIQPANDYNFETYLAIPACGGVVNGPNQTGVIANTASAPLALNAAGDPGNWTSSGAGTFADPHDPNTTYTPNCAEAGSVTTLTWTSSCNSVGYTQTISVPLPSLSVNNATVCSGTPATLNAVGGSAYTWSANAGGATTSSVNVTPGITTTYTVTSTLANGCVVSLTPTVTVNSVPTMVSVNKTDITCFGNIDGILNGNASGGTAPYEFSFTGGPPFFPNPISGLSAGSYTLYTRDANGCVSSNWMMNSIGEPPAINLSLSSVDVSCFGGFDGSATITAIGGVGGFNYSWVPIGGSAPTASGLSAGSYTCNVLDGNSCPASYTVAITQPASITVSPSGQNDVTCNGGSDGSATVTAFGGMGGFSYSWSPSGGIAAASFGLSAGNYTCTATDVVGCSAMQTFTINEPTPVTLTSNTQTNILCNGAATGDLSVFPATGGSGFGYEYSLNGGPFTLGSTNFTGLSAGNYTVVARDNNLCLSNSVTFTLTEPSKIALGTAGNSSPCSSTALSVTLTGSGGAGGYSYSWIATADNPNTTGENFSTLSNTSLINNTITNLTAAAEIVNYSVNVTDANGCVANFNVPTTILPAPTITPISNQVLCAGANNTAIVFTASIGGSTINWTNSNVSIGISGSGIGTITAVPMINAGITPVVANFIATPNFSGCNGPSQNFNITVNPLPTVTNAPTASTCEGVALNIPLTSNIGGTTYTWISNNNPNTTGESISTMSTGLINNTINNITAVNQPLQYTVTPTVSGCVGTALTLTVTVFPQPNLIDPADQTLCAGSLTSAINFTSDVGGSTFSWTNSNASIGIPASGTTNIASATATNAGASPIVGNFSAQATANGCISTPQVFSITVNPIPTTPVPTASSSCLGSSTNFTTPFFAGGSYNWNFGDGNTTTTQNPNHTYVAAGVYTASVTVTAATCVSAVGTVNATVNPTSVGGTITGGTTPACNGANSGTLTLVGNTGTVNGWEFSTDGGTIWNPIANTTTSQVYSNLTVTTMYRAIVQSGVCSAINSTTRIIVINDPPSASNAGIDQSLCNQTTATLSANAPGVGTGSWSVISGSAIVTTPTSPTSGVTGLTIGASSVLRWTIANSPCTSTTDDVTITSNPNPTIGGSLTSCTAGTSLLTGTGTTLSWSSSNTLVATINATSGLVSPLIPGTTNITYTNTDGCTAVATFTATLTPPTPTLTSNSPICEGSTLNLGTSDVGTYNWSGPNGFTSTLQNPTINNITTAGAGTYSLTVTTGVCLSGIGTINVVVNPLPSGTVSPVDATCNGGANGSVTVTPSGTGPFMYSYNGSAFVGTATQTGLSVGNYTVNVQSGAGCISSDILYTINEPIAITGSIVTSSDPSCSGSSDGSATINATGGNGIYNYSVDGGAYSPSNPILGLIAGPHLVNIQDGNGCFSAASVNFSLTDPLPLTVSNVTTDVSCFGGSNGTITATGSGGAGGYQYSLDNIIFQAPTIFSSLSAGSYTVYITDASGCTSGSTTFISQPASNFLITTLGLDYVCDGEALAETFTSSGGFGTITYSWAAQPNPNGATSGSGNTISETLSTITTDPNVPETVIYDLSAIDQNGCSATSTFTAYVHPLPPVNITSNVNPLCVSSVATLAATYIGDFIGWNPTAGLTVINNDSATFTPPASGNFVVTYTVAMNTGANCTNSGAITLTVTPAPSAPTLAVNSPVCAGSPVNLTSNTIAGATYLWSGPNGFTSTLEDPTIPVTLPADAGTYTCTVDVAGCTSSSTINVVVNPKPQAIVLGVSTTFCANETFTLDGSNSLHNSSAITNFQWQLNGVDIPGANAFAYIGNTPGAYKLIVTNDLGCKDTTLTPNIANADPIPTPVINGANGFCFGGNATLDGTASGAGGASVIDNYEWLLNGTSVSSGPTNDTYLATVGGDYQLVVLNSNGCKDTTALFTVTVNPTPSLPSVTPDPINVCVGGSVNISVNSPVAGSTYTWASINAETSISLTTGNSNTVNGLAPGIASITVTETNSFGCTGPTYSVTVNINSAPIAIASFTSNDTICYNGNVSVTLNAITGGTYSWNSSIGLASASQSVTFTNITNSGNVQFYGTVIDAAGCSSLADTINLFVQNQPTVPVISNSTSVCPGQAFTLDVSPIIPGADYYWTDPSATTQNGINLTSITIPVATAITAGPYVVYYIDPLGCTSATSSLYNQPLDPTPIVSISGISTICSGNSTLLSASTSVGTASAYQWYNNGTIIAGATSASYNVSTPGNYNVKITSTTGCMDSAAVGTTVNVSSGPTVIANPTSSSVCAGNSATISASGALTYSWDTGATTPSITVNPTVTTSYIVTGTDAGGCTNSDTAVVIVNALPATPTITASSITECAGTSVSLSSSSTLTNTWINASTLAVIGTTQNISHTETVAGVYNYGVYVTDANSCNSATANIAVTFNSCLTNLISDNASTNSNIPISGNFLTNDGSPSIFTTATIISGPANGAITVSSNGNFTYTPNTNFSGYNMVVVQVCDVTPTCLNDTIYIVVNPNANNDTYTVNGLSSPNTVIGNVLVNDAGTGIAGNVSLVNSVTNGIIVIDTLGNFTYTPNSGFCGTDNFTYNLCDQNGLCTSASANIIVTCDSTVTTTTGFSPNGDGVNDNWVIQGIETTQNTVTVFDRWGNQVISFTNYNNTNTAWDGKNSNGVELPAGTYFYSIDIPNEKSKKGWVEITK